MNYINFSKSYHARMLIERDIPLILRLCEKNTQFYEHCPPFVTAESIRDDMCALPQRKMDESQDKYYLGFFDDAEQLVAVMDFIDHYPTEQKLLHRILYDGTFCTGTWHWKQDHHRAVCVSAQSGLRVYPAGLCGWQQAK